MRGKRWMSAGFLGMMLAWPAGGHAQGTIRYLRAPVKDGSQELALLPTETHRWTFQLAPGGFVQVRVLQIGIDVVLRVRNPAGELRQEFDSPNGTTGTETASWLVDRGGAWTLEVAPLDAEKGGRYRLYFVEERSA